MTIKKIVSSSYRNFTKGLITNVFDRNVHNRGFLGGEDERPKSKENTTWRDMVRRCYDDEFKIKNPTYENCKVCEEWLNFQNFAKWYDENYYEVDGQRMELDKDILVKDNKIYSPETCIFVPQNINTLFIKANSIRGQHPIGVSFHKPTEKYRATCNNIREVYLGLFDTSNEAFNTYKIYKEKLIKSIAEKYKNEIPQKLYDAMYQYKVEIND